LVSPSSLRAEGVDYDLPDGSGHFYTQTNGQGGSGGSGYSVANADGIPFWNEYRRLGGTEVLGYPVSRRFVWDGFVVQAMQKVVLQWRPETGRAAVVSPLDELTRAGKADWLETQRLIPRPAAFPNEAPLVFDQIVAARLAL